MARYRHRPIQVDAWRNDDIGEAPPPWINESTSRTAGGRRIINADAGDVFAELGDWIVRDDRGNLLIYTPQAFTDNYERVR